MRAIEFLTESTTIASNEQVWDYVCKIHPEEEQGGGFLKRLIMRHPQYQLKRVPLSSLHIPDQEYDDAEQEPDTYDPYGRGRFVDFRHAGEYSMHHIDKRPIVIDTRGYILDGTHRAWAASELMNKKDIMAYVPVLQLKEGQSVKQEIKDFIYSLAPDDVGVEEFPGYRIHFEGFTDECKSSSDYQKNPNKVYQQVYQDFIEREGGTQPVKSGMVGDEEYPILYSVFKAPQSKSVDTAEKAYSIAYKKKQPWPRGSREEKLIRSDWQLSGLYDQYVLKQGVAEAKASTAAFRAGNKKRAELNSMSDQERRAYDKEQQEKQRKRDDARLERERSKNKGVAEGSEEINWIKPNFDYEWDEIEFQAKQPQVPADVRNYMSKHFPNKQAWMKSVQHGRPVVVSPDHGQKIRNYTDNKQDLLNALSPQSHDPQGPAKAKRVNALFDKGGPIEMPIILQTEKGLWLIGGKTRLGTANLLKGIPAKVWMIGGEQGVTEAFNQPYDIRWSKGDHGDYDAFARLEDDSSLEIGFLDQQHNSWMVDFFRDSSTEVTGEGDAYRVFATVLTAMRQFIDKRKPAKLNFSAEKDDDPTGSRAKLYDRMIQRYIGDTGYTITRNDYSDAIIYTLTRIKPRQQLTELGDSPSEYKPNSKRKRSLFHSTVDNHWVDVFFDRSEFNDTLHITFSIDGNYDKPRLPIHASKSIVKIMSTVLNIIKRELPEYMRKARPPSLSFTAKEDNRASLYRKYFVPTIQGILGPKWELSEYQSMGSHVFNWKPARKINNDNNN